MSQEAAKLVVTLEPDGTYGVAFKSEGADNVNPGTVLGAIIGRAHALANATADHLESVKAGSRDVFWRDFEAALRVMANMPIDGKITTSEQPKGRSE